MTLLYRTALASVWINRPDLIIYLISSCLTSHCCCPHWTLIPRLALAIITLLGLICYSNPHSHNLSRRELILRNICGNRLICLHCAITYYLITSQICYLQFNRRYTM